MSIDPTAFVFDVASLLLDERQDFIAQVPPSLTDRKSLFDALQRALQFPYFGGNWDALSDCLRDLSWIDRRRVVILHEDSPQLDTDTLSVYLDVLSHCVRDWKTHDDHKLVVAFPARSQDAIVALAALQQ